jgi:predicted nucleic acid-binding protein
MNVLVDSSIWIDYFRGGKYSRELDLLIDENLICTNDLILAELIPPLAIKKENRLVNLLYEVAKIALDIDWSKIVNYQIACLSGGINRVGIPDLIILDNVTKNDLILFTKDKHFKLINEHIEFEMWKN